MQHEVYLLCHPKFKFTTLQRSISAQHTLKPPPQKKPMVIHHCHKKCEGPPQGPLESNLGRLILWVFPRGVPTSSLRGT